MFNGLEKGPNGLTPLHLSAYLGDQGQITFALLSSNPPEVYAEVQADDGVTPFHLALQMGHFSVNQLVEALKNSRTPCHTLVEGRQCCQPRLLEVSIV